MKTKHLSLVVLPLLAGLACSDFGTSPDRTPAEFRMTPDSVRLTEGETVTFEFTVLDEDGNPYEAIPDWASPRWTFSEDSVMRVDVTGVGEATGPGEARGTAELGGLQAEALIQVNPVALEVDLGFVQITQSVQRERGDVPLIAGRDGLLRVFVEAEQPNFFRPKVLATFYRDGAPVHTVLMEHEEEGLPEFVEEGDLDLTFDALISGSLLQPGTSLVIEIDPDGLVPALASNVLRHPETGTRPLDIVEASPLQIRLVPVSQSLTGLESRFTAETAAEHLELTHAIFPLPAIDVDVRAPYMTDADLSTENGWYRLIEEIVTLRLDDGSPRYYYGGFRRPPGSGILGLGYVGYPVAIGDDGRDGTTAHEIGHNLSLPHAPCGGPASADPRYPYPGGITGQWGYDLRSGYLRDPVRRYDLMTYCDPIWISDYNYERVIAYRDTSEFDAMPAASGIDAAAGQGTLIVHAGVRNGALYIGPAITSAGPASLPEEGGRYTLTGLDEGGASLFTVAFDPIPLDHLDGALFSAAIPATVAQPERLASLRVTGPEGRVERGRSGGAAVREPRVALAERAAPIPGAAVARWDATAFPLAVVRDRLTGRIVAMSRNGTLDLPGDPSAFTVMLSDGVRTHPAQLERR